MSRVGLGGNTKGGGGTELMFWQFVRLSAPKESLTTSQTMEDTVGYVSQPVPFLSKKWAVGTNVPETVTHMVPQIPPKTE